MLSIRFEDRANKQRKKRKEKKTREKSCIFLATLFLIMEAHNDTQPEHVSIFLHVL